MQIRAFERLTRTLGLVLAAAVGPALALALLGHIMVMFPMRLHAPIVGAAGFATFGGALAMTVIGARRGDGRAVLVGTAFSAMAAMLFVHALATPGLLVGPNGLVQLAGAGNVPVGAAVLSLSAWRRFRGTAGVGLLLKLQPTLLTAIATVGVVGLSRPTVIPILPGPGGSPALVVMAIGLILLGLLGYRAARTFQLTRRGTDLAVLIGVAWLGCALAGLLLFDGMELGFWLAHVFEVAGLGLVGVPVVLDLRRGALTYPLAGDLSAARLVSEEETFMGPRVRALLARLAEKDSYTAAHTRRVALLAVQVGERLGLSPARLRTLAIGGLLHDMGKLSVPDEVLQKPGPLSDEELAVVRRHPVWGDELLDELGRFGPDVHRLVLDHHERLDGCGYPRGLAAGQLNLETRILTACDVYDALITKRVYREAWTADRALSLLHEETGVAFDVRCVAALAVVVGGERTLAAAA